MGDHPLFPIYRYWSGTTSSSPIYWSDTTPLFPYNTRTGRGPPPLSQYTGRGPPPHLPQNEMAINVFGYENKAIIVYQLSEQPASMARINILLFYEGEKSHYVWIKDLNKLLFDQTKCQHRQHFCERCLHGYSREDLLQRYIPECNRICDRAVRIEMPKKGKNDTLILINFHRKMKVPFVIYAEFETILKKIDDRSKTNTKTLNEHVVCGYSYVVVGCDGKKRPPNSKGRGHQ